MKRRNSESRAPEVDSKRTRTKRTRPEAKKATHRANKLRTEKTKQEKQVTKRTELNERQKHKKKLVKKTTRRDSPDVDSDQKETRKRKVKTAKRDKETKEGRANPETEHPDINVATRTAVHNDQNPEQTDAEKAKAKLPHAPDSATGRCKAPAKHRRQSTHDHRTAQTTSVQSHAHEDKVPKT
ncbi:hypothetical protein Tco_0248442 [Tanacetum coccineum]